MYFASYERGKSAGKNAFKNRTVIWSTTAASSGQENGNTVTNTLHGFTAVNTHCQDMSRANSMNFFSGTFLEMIHPGMAASRRSTTTGTANMVVRCLWLL